MENTTMTTRYWLAGAAAFVMTAGIAAAQTSDTTTSTTVTAPVTGAYSSSKTQTTVAPNGTQTDKSQTYDSGSGGTNAMSTTKTISPDGSQQKSWHQEWTGSQPAANSTTTSKSTTITQ
jgi:hypothetical protein